MEKWEAVSSEKGGRTERLAVPGGWMYRTVIYGNDSEAGVAMCFLADVDAMLRKTTQASVDMARLVSAAVDEATQ